eukprot:UN10456
MLNHIDAIHNTTKRMLGQTDDDNENNDVHQYPQYNTKLVTTKSIIPSISLRGGNTHAVVHGSNTNGGNNGHINSNISQYNDLMFSEHSNSILSSFQ